MAIVVHVTHEAVHKVGGIGAVLAGLVTAAPCRQRGDRTILVGPLLDRLRDQPLGPDGTVLYDNWSGVWSDAVGMGLYDVETRRGVRLVYGTRRFTCPDGSTVEPEVLLVDVEGSVPHGLGTFKGRLFEHLGLTSDRYEGIWEYEQYVRLAEPAYDAVMALTTERGDTPVQLIAHEFMGLPTAFKAMLDPAPGVFTVFYAHEVATARRLVEDLPGGDLAFYGGLREALDQGRTLEDQFGPQDAYFKHALVRQAWRCDALFAVGDLVVDELRALGPEFAGREIERVYNGVPLGPAIDAAAREAARGRLADAVEGWLGWRPDLVLTHVGRLVASKGLWRDLRVMEALDDWLAESGRRAALLVLATEAGPRLGSSIEPMVRDYGWPVAHREGYPDLTPGELTFDLLVRRFNARSRQGAAVFVNQFGFDAASTGGALPEGTGFADLRGGSDAELGLSTYEPFGIAQIEPLAFGAVSVVSDTCGCLGFLRQVAPAGGPPVFVCGDFAGSGGEDWRYMEGETRRAREGETSRAVAAALARALPADAGERAERLTVGYETAAQMSWDRVAATQYLPALDRLLQRRG
jgi:hypothetical protein